MTIPATLSASSIDGDEVCNAAGENLGEIKDLMIDVSTGKVSYAVLSYGGVFGLGDKLFAVPWGALSLRSGDHKMQLDVDKDKIKNAPGFDKDNWPNFADPTFNRDVHGYYGVSY